MKLPSQRGRTWNGWPLPPRLAYIPELTDDDVRWLNKMLEVVDSPTVRFDNKLPRSPVVFYDANGHRNSQHNPDLWDHRPRMPPPDTGWIKTEWIRG